MYTPIRMQLQAKGGIVFTEHTSSWQTAEWNSSSVSHAGEMTLLSRSEDVGLSLYSAGELLVIALADHLWVSYSASEQTHVLGRISSFIFCSTTPILNLCSMTGHGLMAWDATVRKMRPVVASNVILSGKLVVGTIWTSGNPVGLPYAW